MPPAGATTSWGPLSLLKPHGFQIAGLIVLILVSALAEAVGLTLLSVMLNVLLGVEVSTSSSLLAPLYRFAEENQRVFLAAVGIAYIGRTLIGLLAAYASFSIAFHVMDDWRLRLLRAYFFAPLQFANRHHGAMLHSVIVEPTYVAGGLGAAGLLIQNAFSALIIYGVLLAISPRITLIVTVIAMAAGLLIGALSRYSRIVAARRSQAWSEGYTYLTEMLNSLKQLRLFNLEATSQDRAAEHLKTMRGLGIKMNVAASSPRLLIELVFLIGTGVMLVILLPTLGDAAVLSAVGVAVAAVLRLLPTLSASAGTWVQVQQALPAMRNIFDELTGLEAAVAAAGSSGRRAKAVWTDRIMLEDVHFSYPGREQALASATIEIPRGSFTGIVGPSGSGKSTVVDMLCGFYPPDLGRVIVDGVDLRDIDQADWRRLLGVVPQDAFLFSGTLRENLLLLRPDCPETRLREILTLVGADQFVSDLPAGLDTRVGERGLSLSGGQRQRLALARVLVKDPAILILDEATSALDAESEEFIKQGLERIRGRVTLIVIAHRLSLVRQADRIYVLDGGKVVESGRHDEMVERGGCYAAMLRTAEA